MFYGEIFKRFCTSVNTGVELGTCFLLVMKVKIMLKRLCDIETFISV